MGSNDQKDCDAKHHINHVQQANLPAISARQEADKRPSAQIIPIALYRRPKRTIWRHQCADIIPLV